MGVDVDFRIMPGAYSRISSPVPSLLHFDRELPRDGRHGSISISLVACCDLVLGVDLLDIHPVHITHAFVPSKMNGTRQQGLLWSNRQGRQGATR